MNARLPILLLCVALLTVFTPAIPCRADSPTPKSDPKIESLIDQLAQVDKPGVGYSGNATFERSFLPVDDHPKTDGASFDDSELTEQEKQSLLNPNPATLDKVYDKLIWSRTATSPALIALVRLGPQALPELVAHVDDERPTKLVITGYDGGLPGSIVLEDDYDPRAGGIHRMGLTD